VLDDVVGGGGAFQCSSSSTLQLNPNNISLDCRYSKGLDDSFVAFMAIADGSCEAAISWGQPSPWNDNPLGIAVDSDSGDVSLGVLTCGTGYDVMQHLVQITAVRCNHGTVSSLLKKCLCDPGYLGPSCNIACPGGAATPCTNHGVCYLDGTTPACHCSDG
jgi:hypothetical protein